MNSTINLPPLPDLSSLPPEVSDSLVKYLNSIQSALLSISGYLDESTHHLHSSLNHFNSKSFDPQFFSGYVFACANHSLEYIKQSLSKLSDAIARSPFSYSPQTTCSNPHQ